ncbi:MAG TPA: hypothetical protein VKJ01_24230, partial [Candidatus Solibacter sp.]|nr:hypothetical protein [Candidatus Solibacter sp.]
RRARVRAAQQDNSVSAVVQQFLMEYSQAESDFERRKRLQAETLATIREFRAADRLGREELHERRR